MGRKPDSVLRPKGASVGLVRALDKFTTRFPPLTAEFDLDDACRQWRETNDRQRDDGQQAAAMSQAGPSNHQIGKVGVPMVAQSQQHDPTGMQMAQAQYAGMPQQHPVFIEGAPDPRLLNAPRQGMRGYASYPAMYPGVPMYYPPMGIMPMNGVMAPPLPPPQSRPSSRAAHAPQPAGIARKRSAESDSPSSEEHPDSPPQRKKARGPAAPSPAPQPVQPPQYARATPVPFPVFYDPSQGESRGLSLCGFATNLALIGIPMNGAMPYPQMLQQPLTMAQQQYLAYQQSQMAQHQLQMARGPLTPEQQMARDQQRIRYQHVMSRRRYMQHLAAQQNGAVLMPYAHIQAAQNYAQMPVSGPSTPSHEIPGMIHRNSASQTVVPGVPIAHGGVPGGQAPERLYLAIPQHPPIQTNPRPVSSDGNPPPSVRSLPYHPVNNAQGRRVPTPAQPQPGSSRLAPEPSRPRPTKQSRAKGTAASRDSTPARTNTGKGKGKARIIEIVDDVEEAGESCAGTPSTSEPADVVSPPLPPTPPPEPLGEHDRIISSVEMLSFWHEYTRRQRAACNACQSKEDECQVLSHRDDKLDVHDWMIYDDENIDAFYLIRAAVPADGFRVSLPSADGRHHIDHQYLFEILSSDELDTLALSFFASYLTSPLLSSRVSNDDDTPSFNPDTSPTDSSSSTD